MDLDEYLWRKKIRVNAFANQIGVTPTNLSLIKNKKVAPSLYTAAKIVHLSDGVISYEELLKESHMEEIGKKINA